MSASGGIGLSQLAKNTLMRLKRDTVIFPPSADDDFIVASVDPSTIAVGGTFTLDTGASGIMFPRARRVTMTLNDDDSGGGTTITVRITGQRWGLFVSEMLTVTTVDTNDIVGTSANVYDEVTEVMLMAKTSDTGDDLTMGWDDLAFGLDFPIDNVTDVQRIAFYNGASSNALTNVAPSTTSVKVVATGGSVAGGSYIVVSDLAATDIYEVRYLASQKFDGFGVKGVWA